MGEQRIREVSMVIVILLLLVGLLLLALVSRIWIDPTPLDSSTIDLVTGNNPGGSDTQTTS